MSLFREAFWREYVMVLLVTVLLGAGGAAAAAGALDAALGDAASGLLGDVGQYHLMVHVRQDYRAAAARELERLLEAGWPGAVLQEGVTVAGNANFLVSLPQRFLRQPVLESLASKLGDVPGFNGYTWLLEPSMTVSGLRPGVQDLVVREAAALPGVRLVVRHGSSATILLETVEAQRPVADALRALVEGRHVAEVRFPVGDAADAHPVAAAVRAVLGSQLIADVTHQGAEAESQEALAALRDVLAEVAAKVHVQPLAGEPSLTVGERVVLQGEASAPPVPGEPPHPDHLIVELTQWEGGAFVGRIVHGDAPFSDGLEAAEADAVPATTAFHLVQGAVGPPVGEAVIESPRWALDDGLDLEAAVVPQLEHLVQTAQEAVGRLADAWRMVEPDAAGTDTGERAQRLAQALRSGDAASVVRETLLGVVVAALLRAGEASALDGDGDGAQAAANAGTAVDGGEGDRLGSGAGGSGTALAQLEALRESLSRLAESAAALEEGVVGQGLAAFADVQRRLLALRDDELTQLLQTVEGATGSLAAGQRLEFLVDGDVAAAELEQMVRAATGIDVTVVTASAGVVAPSPRSLVLELLQNVRRSIAGLGALLAAAAALVLDHATVFAALAQMGWRRRAVTGLGAALGVLLLGGTYGLSGAAVPWVGPGTVAIAGALLGMVTALLAQRLSPVKPEEILAGQSLGLSSGQILREIVVPAGRPGLLSLVNHWRREFR